MEDKLEKVEARQGQQIPSFHLSDKTAYVRIIQIKISLFEELRIRRRRS